MQKKHTFPNFSDASSKVGGVGGGLLKCAPKYNDNVLSLLAAICFNAKRWDGGQDGIQNCELKPREVVLKEGQNHWKLQRNFSVPDLTCWWCYQKLDQQVVKICSACYQTVGQHVTTKLFNMLQEKLFDIMLKNVQHVIKKLLNMLSKGIMAMSNYRGHALTMFQIHCVFHWFSACEKVPCFSTLFSSRFNFIVFCNDF